MKIQEDILKLLSFHKTFATVVVIQTILPESVKLEEKVTQKMDKYQSIRNPKLIKPHTSASRDTKFNFILHTTDIFLETSEKMTHS